jgi:hypothetical protein
MGEHQNLHNRDSGFMDLVYGHIPWIRQQWLPRLPSTAKSFLYNYFHKCPIFRQIIYGSFISGIMAIGKKSHRNSGLP